MEHLGELLKSMATTPQALKVTGYMSYSIDMIKVQRYTVKYQPEWKLFSLALKLTPYRRM